MSLYTRKYLLQDNIFSVVLYCLNYPRSKMI